LDEKMEQKNNSTKILATPKILVEDMSL